VDQRSGTASSTALIAGRLLEISASDLLQNTPAFPVINLVTAPRLLPGTRNEKLGKQQIAQIFGENYGWCWNGPIDGQVQGPYLPRRPAGYEEASCRFWKSGRGPERTRMRSSRSLESHTHITLATNTALK
jgi:hypothetical protein